MDDKESGGILELMTEEDVKEAAEAWQRINATTEKFANAVAQSIPPIVLNSTGYEPGTIVMRKD
ncbi:MAG: hypothetical protein VZR64_00335 [Eubacterium sp.]|nr:hypothetical protein [Eubacterium sp.]